MAGPFIDRTLEYTTTVGTGPITVQGTPPNSYVAWNKAGNGTVVYYALLSGDGAGWEVGSTTLSVSGAVSTIARNPLASSAAGGPINLTGTSTIFSDVPASVLNGLSGSLGTLNPGFLLGNTGTIAAVAGPVAIGGGLTIGTGGTVTLGSGGTLTGASLVTPAISGASFTGGSLGGTISNGGTINGGSLGGTIALTGTLSGGALAGAIALSGTVTNSGAINGGTLGGSITNAGTISGGNLGGTIALAGTISGGTLSGITITGTVNETGSVQNIGTINNTGQIINAGTGQIINNGTLFNNGLLTSTGTITANGVVAFGGTVALTGTLASTGTISGGTLAGSITNAGTLSGGTLAGSIAATGTLSLATTGLLISNTGTIAAAGITQVTAAVLTAQDTTITSGAGGVLVPGVAGVKRIIRNRSGAAQNIYPAIGAQLEALGANAPAVLPNNSTFTVTMATATQGYID